MSSGKGDSLRKGGDALDVGGHLMPQQEIGECESFDNTSYSF